MVTHNHLSFRCQAALSCVLWFFLLSAAAQPSITNEPQSFTESATYGASFAVGVAGTPPFAYQWLLDGTNLAGATSSTLTLPNLSTNMAGSYTVIVTNASGSVTSSPPAVLTVNPALVFFTLPSVFSFSGLAADAEGLAVDNAGNIYVANQGNGTVQKLTPAGVLTTLASGISLPLGVAVDNVGNVYVDDRTSIQKVSPAGSVGTFASGFVYLEGIALDNAGNVYASDAAAGSIVKVTQGGTMATLTTGLYTGSYAPYGPAGLAVDGADNVYVANQGDDTIRKVTPAGVVTIIGGSLGVVGSVDGAGGVARFNLPSGVAMDSASNIYVADEENNTIRLMTPAGVVTTLAGLAGSSGNVNGTGSAARFNVPSGVAVDSAGNVYVVDTGNQTVRKGVLNYGQPIITNLPASQAVWAQSNVTLTAGVQSAVPVTFQWQFNGVNVAGATTSTLTLSNVARSAAGSYTLIVSNLYGVSTSWPPAVLTVQAPLTFITLAGLAGVSGGTDGVGTNARFNNPTRIAVDNYGTLYVTDAGNNTIRKFVPGGMTATLAGQAGVAGFHDGLGTNATFNYPDGIALDQIGNVFVADYGNNAVRKISPTGDVSTVAVFNEPEGVAFDALGNAFVAAQDGTIHEILLDGQMNIIVGQAGTGYQDGPASMAKFGEPYGLAFDSEGNIYVGDGGNRDIRKLTLSGGNWIVSTLPGSFGGQGDYLGVALDSAGNLFVSDLFNKVIWEFTQNSASVVAGQFQSAGSADGTGTAATFNSPAGICVDNSGNFYITDAANDNIREGVPNYGQPIITSLPASATVWAQSNVTLTAGVQTAVPVSFQWQLNGLNVAGATTNTLTLSNVPRSAAGSYTLIVSNLYGVSTSWPPAVLTVQAPLTVFTLAGLAGTTGTNDGAGSAARFAHPFGLAVDSAGNLYVGDQLNQTIRKVTPAGIVTTLAGVPGVAGTQDGTGGTAQFNYPSGVAVDSADNIYVADYHNQTIRRVTPSGVVTTLAGLAGSSGSADGMGNAARFNGPAWIAADTAGNLYVSDVISYTVRKVAPVGTNWVVTTQAGLAGAEGGSDGTGSAARFGYPGDLTSDTAGNLYVPDFANDTIRKVTPVGTNGAVTTIAGTPGVSGAVDGPGNAALFNGPIGAAVDSAGSIYIGEQTVNTIRKLTASGATWSVATVAGTSGVSGSADGTGASAGFSFPQGLAVDSAGNVYVADSDNNTIRKGVPNYGQPIITNFPASQTAVADSAAALAVMAFNNPPLAYQWQFNGANLPNATNATLNLTNVQPANAGNYVVVITNAFGGATSAVMSLTVLLPPSIVAQPQNNIAAVGQSAGFSVTAAGSGVLSYQWLFNGLALPAYNTILTVAGNGTAGYSGDGGTASNAELSTPTGVTVDAFGNLFIADAANNRIRKVGTNGIISTVAGNGTAGYSGDGGPATNAALSAPSGVGVDLLGNLFVADSSNDRIRKVGTNGIITTVAGNGTAGYSGDGGPATNAEFHFPYVVAVDASGNLFIPDIDNHRVRQVGTNGIITTVAGNGTAGYSGDGILATSAELSYPEGAAFNTYGDLFIGDQHNLRIRQVGTNGIITTVAGNGTAGYSGDGAAATNAELSYPGGVAVDAFGNLFIADELNNRIREVRTNGIITTVAGNGTAGYSGDGAAATNAELSESSGVVVDASGNLFIADYGNQRVRKVVNSLVNQPILALSDVTAGNAGSYSVVVTSAYGSITSAVATLAVEGTAVTSANINSTWTAANSPYVVSGSFSATNLTIQPGVSVWFNGSYSLTVTGLLNAVGTSNNPITFSGVGWQGLRFVSANTNSTLAWCVVSGASAGGIRLTNTPFAMTNCLVVSNTGVSGGGIYTDSALWLQSCTLANNQATYGQQTSPYFVQGGGLYSLNGGVTLQSCVVSNNTAVMPNLGSVVETSSGGGIDCEGGTLALINSTVVNNQTLGAGLSSAALGGGVYLNSATATLNAIGCVFQSNSAAGGFGGGASLGVAGLLACAFSGNQAAFGGAMYTGGSGQTMATNLLLAGNSASLGGAVYSTAGQAAGDFENCTLYGNAPDGFNGYTGLIHNSILYSNRTEIVQGLVSPVVTYSDVQGGYAGLGETNVNPQFEDLTNFLLGDFSPCINAGDPAPQYNNGAYPPAQEYGSTDENDLGAYGGPGSAFWPQYAVQVPVVLVNGQPTVPYQVLTFTNTNPPTISFGNGYAGGSFHYTLDGSNPTQSSYSLYSGSFLLSNSVTIRVLAENAAQNAYTIAAPVIVNVPPAYPVAASTAGGGNVSPTSGTYLSNSVATLTATASNGWQFLYWTNGVTGTNNPLAVAVTSPLTNIQAVFGTSLSVSLNPLSGSGGSVQTNPVLAYYPYGSTAQLMAKPAANHYFQDWNIGGVQYLVSPLDFIVTNASPAITAVFGSLPANTYALTLLVSGNGNVSPNPLASDYAAGTIVALTATPQAGYVFTGWSGGAVGTGNQINVTMNSSLTVTAAFAFTAPPQALPPTVALTNPVAGTQFNSPTNITLNATASDPNSDGSISQVAFFAQGTNQLGVVTNIPYAFVWTNPPIGTNNLTAVASNNHGLTATSAVVSITVVPGPPVFTLSSGSYFVYENGGSVSITVLKSLNSLGGIVNYSTQDGSAVSLGSLVNYQSTNGSLTFNAGDVSKTISIPIVDNFIYEGNTSFGFSLTASGDGSTLGSPGSATVAIIDVNQPAPGNSLLLQVFPQSAPTATGQLSVYLAPAQAGGQWRFPWDLEWRTNGQTVNNLPSDNYPIQFQAVPGYLPIPLTNTVGVTNGGTTAFTNQYLPAPTFSGLGTASLTVNIGPNTPAGAGWQIYGMSGSYLPGATVTNLLPGTYFLLFNGVGGWSTPAELAVPVAAGESEAVTVNYQLAATPPAGAVLPGAVPLSNLGDLRDFPYGYNGELQTDVGYGSGVVVRENIVLTAAHMIFNDETLSYVSQAYWSFQQEGGTFGPDPQPARGWYVLGGYAAQRITDLGGGYAPDQSSPQSQNLDVAALYFLTPAGRGGYGGYLASDTVPNPWLSSSQLKMLVGYPVDGSVFGQTVQPGTLYNTSPIPSLFVQQTNQVYVTGSMLSYPGNSGGPVYVRYTNGTTYYPAAVYLGTVGSGLGSQTVVRAIDGQVVNLITLAAALGDSGTNNSGGGVITIIPSLAVNQNNPGYLILQLGPPAAVQAGAAWKLVNQPASYYSTANPSLQEITTNNSIALQFKPIPGWNLPTNSSVTVFPNVIVTNIAFYTQISASANFSSANLNGNQLVMTFTAGVGQNYALDRSTNLLTWTPLVTNTVPVGGTLNFSDTPSASNSKSVFYRARLVP